MDDLQALCDTIDVVGSPDFVEWLPSFGCAILALGQLPPAHGDGGAGALSFGHRGKVLSQAAEASGHGSAPTKTFLMFLYECSVVFTYPGSKLVVQCATVHLLLCDLDYALCRRCDGLPAVPWGSQHICRRPGQFRVCTTQVQGWKLS